MMWNVLGVFGAAASTVPPTFTFTDIGTYSAAYGINNSGQVVGVASILDGTEHAFFYSNGTMYDLGTLGGTKSQANAINDDGQIVGSSYTSNGSKHAFLYSNGVMNDLGTLAGAANPASESQAAAINSSGQVVGSSFTSSTSGYRLHAFLYSNGVMNDLGASVFDFSSATAINSSGQAVGYASNTNVPGSSGALFSNDTTYALNTLLQGGSNSNVVL